MWLFPGAPKDPEDDTVMEKHGAEALYSVVKSLMHAMGTKDEEAKQDVAHWMIPIAKPWTIRQWLESQLANGKRLIEIPTENGHVIDLEWSKNVQPQLKTLVERYTSLGTSGAWRVH